MRNLIIGVLLSLGMITNSIAGTDVLSWSQCDQYTDGSVLPPEELAGYRIYLSDQPGGPYTLVGETTDLSTTNTTPSGKNKYYTVTCVTIYDLESGYSNEALKEGKRAKAPGQLRAE